MLVKRQPIIVNHLLEVGDLDDDSEDLCNEVASMSVAAAGPKVNSPYDSVNVLDGHFTPTFSSMLKFFNSGERERISARPGYYAALFPTFGPRSPNYPIFVDGYTIFTDYPSFVYAMKSEMHSCHYKANGEFITINSMIPPRASIIRYEGHLPGGQFVINYSASVPTLVPWFNNGMYVTDVVVSPKGGSSNVVTTSLQMVDDVSVSICWLDVVRTGLVPKPVTYSWSNVVSPYLIFQGDVSVTFKGMSDPSLAAFLIANSSKGSVFEILPLTNILLSMYYRGDSESPSDEDSLPPVSSELVKKPVKYLNVHSDIFDFIGDHELVSIPRIASKRFFERWVGNTVVIRAKNRAPWTAVITGFGYGSELKPLLRRHVPAHVVSSFYQLLNSISLGDGLSFSVLPPDRGYVMLDISECRSGEDVSYESSSSDEG